MTARTLAICSMKGGVGKTTIALNLAFAFAQRGTRTLLVDTDAQGAIGLSLKGSLRERAGLAAVARGELAVADAIIQTKLQGLAVLPVGMVDPLGIDAFGESLGVVLAEILAAADGVFDLVMFDTPAGLGGATRKVLESVESVVLPVQCEPLSLRALPTTLSLLASLRQQGARCTMRGVVANMSSFRDPVNLAVLEEVWALYGRVIIETSIPKDPVFLEASRAGVPVGLLARRPPAIAMVFDKLAAELEAPLGILEEEASHDEPISLVD